MTKTSRLVLFCLPPFVLFGCAPPSNHAVTPAQPREASTPENSSGRRPALSPRPAAATGSTHPLTPAIKPHPAEPATRDILEAILTPAILAARAQAQAKILGPRKKRAGGSRPSSALAADGSARSAPFVAIENESALAPFHRKLARLAAAPASSNLKVRILAYGASHTQGDFYTGYLRYYLQKRFGNGGQGFVHVAKINPWYRQLDTKVASRGFRIQHAQIDEPPEHGRFGLLGAAAIGRYADSYGRVAPGKHKDPGRQASEYQLFYSSEPGGGKLLVSANRQRIVELDTNEADPAARFYSFHRDLGWDKIEVRPKGNGPVRLFGLTIERSGPGIVIDTLGINGTRAANMLLWDQKQWAAQLKRRDPQLLMLAYGTNETTDVKEPITTYEANLREVLNRLKQAVPLASCVLVGPGDFPKHSKDGWFPRKRLLSIIDVQRKVALSTGCGFWDAYAFMGGEGSMHRWASAHPPMGARDHIHLTPRGYVRLATALGDALLRSFDAKYAD